MVDFSDRIINICNELVKADWYQECQDELIQLAKLIPEEAKDTFEQYNDIHEEINIKTQDEIYHKAFKDGYETALI